MQFVNYSMHNFEDFEIYPPIALNLQRFMLKFRIQDIVLTSWGQFPLIRSTNQLKYYQPPPPSPWGPSTTTTTTNDLYEKTWPKVTLLFGAVTQALDFCTLVLLTNCTSALKIYYNYLNSLVRSKNPFRKMPCLRHLWFWRSPLWHKILSSGTRDK